jgi:hypothetical protein
VGESGRGYHSVTQSDLGFLFLASAQLYHLDSFAWEGVTMVKYEKEEGERESNDK